MDTFTKGMKTKLCAILLGMTLVWASCGDPAATEVADPEVKQDTLSDIQPASDPGLLDYVKSQPKAEPQAPSAAKDPGNGSMEIRWDDLADVKFTSKYFEEIDEWLLFPAFGEDIKSLEGKRIFLAGYVIPLEPGLYFLSRNSFQSCFFCGGAGPESVMELDLVDKEALYANDEFLTFTGTLKLNDSDVDRLNYILEGAEVVR